MSQARARRLQSSIPASYTVYLDPDGVTYRAESCKSGLTDINGTDASTVIQAAITALTATGKIFFKNGTYPLTATLNLNDKEVALVGESREGTVLQKSGAVVQYANTVNHEYGGQYIQDLTLDGVDKSDTGLLLQYSHRNFLSNFNIIRCSRALYHLGCVSNTVSGFHIYNNVVGLKLEGDSTMGSVGNNFHGGEIQNATSQAVYIRATSGEAADNSFFGTVIEGSTANTLVNFVTNGAYVPYGNKFFGCYFENIYATNPQILTSTLEGGGTLYSYGDQFNSCKFASNINFKVGDFLGNRIRFCNNEIVTPNGKTATFTIGGNTTLFTGNLRAHPWATTCAVTDSGTGTIFRDNEFYVTENKGTSTIVNTATSSGNIAHGLSYTPVAGDFTITGKENPTNSIGTVWVDGIGGTNFVVNCENDPGASGWDFGWSVRKV